MPAIRSMRLVFHDDVKMRVVRSRRLIDAFWSLDYVLRINKIT